MPARQGHSYFPWGWYADSCRPGLASATHRVAAQPVRCLRGHPSPLWLRQGPVPVPVPGAMSLERETLRGSFLSPLLQRPLWAIKSLLSCDAESQCGDIHPSPRLGMSTSLVFGHPTSRATTIPPLPLSTLWANRWPHSLLSPSPHSLHNRKPLYLQEPQLSHLSAGYVA